ncbi:MAG: hypothetical protein DMG08_11135 [Acidobacteria bacterium]|nr:MAG: hypothetical protein DMG08_11135 [Acidobacteriota bacterium]
MHAGVCINDPFRLVGIDSFHTIILSRLAVVRLSGRAMDLGGENERRLFIFPTHRSSASYCRKSIAMD